MFVQKGIYTIKLTVTSSEGCVVTKTLSNYVNVASYKADFNFSSSEICFGNNVQLTMTSTPTPSQTTWYMGDGNVIPFTVYNYNYGTTGDFQVKLVNSFGTCKDSATKVLKVKPTPVVRGFLDTVVGVCGAPTQVKFRDTTAGAVAWDWNFNYYTGPNTIQSTLQSPVNTYSYDGSYYVRLRVTNAVGCVGETYKYVNITRPTVGINSTYSSSNSYNSACNTLTMRFKYYSSEPLASFKWTTTSGVSSSDAEPEFTFTEAGYHVVRFDYTTVSGCTGTGYYTNIEVRKLTKADFTSLSGTTICGNSFVEFKSTRDNSGITESWYVNGQYVGTSSYNRFRYQFPKEGVYTIMMVSANWPCVDTVIKENYITVTSPITKIARVKYTCEAERDEVLFTDSSRGGTSWRWDFGDGTSTTYSSYVPEIKHTYAATGKYQAFLTVTNGTCTVKDSIYVFVLKKQKPVFASTKSVICSEEKLQISLSNMERNPYDGVWVGYYFHRIEYGDGTVFTGTNDAYSGFVNPMPYTGNLGNFAPGQTQLRIITASAYHNCYDTSNYIPLQVNSTKAAFSIHQNDQCYQLPVSFTDRSTVTGTNSIVSWEWNFGDGNVRTSTTGGTISHSYTNPGGYYVTLKVKDASGCTSSSTSYTGYVRVNGPKAAFNASGTNVPLNSTVYFYNNSNTFNAYGTQYLWDFGNGVTSTQYSPSHTFTAAGTYTVKLTARDPLTGCTSETQQLITVRNFNSNFSFNTSFIGNATCPPVIARFTNTSAGAVRVKWDFGDGTTADNVNYPSHIYSQPGTYIITLFVYGHNGLTGTYTDSVKVKGLEAVLKFTPGETCSSQPVNFNASAAGVSGYLWDFGDGQTIASTDSTAVHLYRGAGVYKPSLLITNTDGCTVAAPSTEKIIIDSLSAKITGVPLQACNQVKINFKADVFSVGANSNSNFLSYKWNFGTGNAADTANTANPVFQYNAPGTYTVSLRVTARSGCVKDVTETVIVKPSSKATITAPSAICAGETATFTATATITNGVQWSWDFKNGQTASLQNPSVQTYATAGSYPVTLVVNNQGCLDTSLHTLSVHALPVVQLLPVQPKVCLGNSVQLTATGGTDYQWMPATTLSDPQTASPFASPVVSTTYRVLVSNQYGCKKADSVLVRVVPPIDIMGKTSFVICAGETVQLAVTGATVYKWINNVQGLSSVSAPNVTAAPDATSSYTVVGYDAENCFTDTLNIDVVVHPNPTVNAGPDVQSLPGSTVQLNATGSSNISSWLWKPADFLSCIQCPSPISTTNRTMLYIVEARTAENCTAADSVKVEILCNGNQIYIPNSFTPNGDGTNDSFTVLGNGASLIKLFVIYDRWGNKVFERKNIAADDPLAKWDGNYNGYPAPVGSFTYSIQLVCDATGEHFVRSGTVTIIR